AASPSQWLAKSPGKHWFMPLGAGRSDARPPRVAPSSSTGFRAGRESSPGLVASERVGCECALIQDKDAGAITTMFRSVDPPNKRESAKSPRAYSSSGSTFITLGGFRFHRLIENIASLEPRCAQRTAALVQHLIQRPLLRLFQSLPDV